MDLILYPRLCPKSKRCMRRTKWRWGKAYFWKPRNQLVTRLMSETGMTREQVLDQLRKERAFILKYPQYY